MSSTITANKNRRTLLSSTLVGVGTSKSITSITRSGTTATITATGHGLVAGDWIIVQGADRPPYNGLFKVATQPDANTITVTLESDPGASAAGTMTLEKVVISLPWGDGTTAVEGVTSIGALSTAEAGLLTARIATTTAPTTVCRASVFKSDTGASGTWRPGPEADGTILANDMSFHPLPVIEAKFVLVAFWKVRGTAVYVDLVGEEITSHTAT